MKKKPYRDFKYWFSVYGFGLAADANARRPGVSNSILDKPGKLDEEEWAAVRSHAMFTENILSRIDAFSELARVAGAHHERLDGNG